MNYQLPQAGWHPDPEDSSQWRYWDGARWSDHRAPRTAGPRAAPPEMTASVPASPVPRAVKVGMSTRQQVTLRVHQILTDYFDQVESHSTDGFTLRKGSARAFIEIHSSSDDHATTEPTFIRITVPLLQQVPESPELHREIAFRADDYRFGTLALRSDDDHGVCIFFCHTLLGDYLDDDELVHALGEMLRDADDLDDELKQQFRGRRFHED